MVCCTATMPENSNSTSTLSTLSSISPYSTSVSSLENSSDVSVLESSSSSDTPSTDLEIVLGENTLALTEGELLASFTPKKGGRYDFNVSLGAILQVYDSETEEWVDLLSAYLEKEERIEIKLSSSTLSTATLSIALDNRLVLGENKLYVQEGETVALSLLGEEEISYTLTWLDERVNVYTLGSDGITKIPKSSGFTMKYETTILYLTTVDSLEGNFSLTLSSPDCLQIGNVQFTAIPASGLKKLFVAPETGNYSFSSSDLNARINISLPNGNFTEEVTALAPSSSYCLKKGEMLTLHVQTSDGQEDVDGYLFTVTQTAAQTTLLEVTDTQTVNRLPFTTYTRINVVHTFIPTVTGYYAFKSYGATVVSQNGSICDGEITNATPTIYYLTAGEALALYCTVKDGSVFENSKTFHGVLTVQQVLGVGEQSITLINGKATLDFYAEEANYFPLLPVDASLEIWEEESASFLPATGLLSLSEKQTFRISSAAWKTLSLTLIKPTKVFEQTNKIILREGTAYLLFTATKSTNYACTLSKTGSVTVFKDGAFHPLQNQIDLEAEAGTSYLLKITAEEESVILSIISEEIIL